MNNRKIIKELKKLRPAPADKAFLTELKENLLEFMRFHPVRSPIKAPVLELSPFRILGGINLVKALSLFLIMAVIFGSGGLAFASEKALPGEPLYALKTFGEDIEQKLTLNPQKKAELNLRLAEKRIGEIKEILAEKGIEPKELSIAERRLAMHITNARQIVEKELEEGRNGKFSEKIKDKLNDVETENKRLEEEIQEKAEEKLEEDSDENEGEDGEESDNDSDDEADDDDESDDDGGDNDTSH